MDLDINIYSHLLDTVGTEILLAENRVRYVRDSKPI